jgi:hypothetical protein
MVIQFDVHNHSESPVFELTLDRIGYIERRDDDVVRPMFEDARFVDHTYFTHISPEGLGTEPTFAPGATVWGDYQWGDPKWFNLIMRAGFAGLNRVTSMKDVQQHVDFGVTISFVDANGRRWTRTNTSPPARRFRRGELPWWRRGKAPAKVYEPVNIEMPGPHTQAVTADPD